MFACSFLALGQYYVRSKPRTPHPDTGETYRVIAGFSPKATIYLTSYEFYTFYFLLVMSSAPALLGGVLNAQWRLFAK